jgi:hypothetical protein
VGGVVDILVEEKRYSDFDLNPSAKQKEMQ